MPDIVSLSTKFDVQSFTRSKYIEHLPLWNPAYATATL